MNGPAFNKRANYDYEILEKYEAGLVLLGHEVKSIKTGHISLKESFVTILGTELYLTNAHIPPYKHAGRLENYDPTRPRKLLVKKSEIKRLIGKARTQGLTLVPIKIYTKRRYLKLEFGLGKGKKEYDKRDKIKKKEAERSMSQLLKSRG
jgi:SsrA-binding protein